LKNWRFQQAKVLLSYPPLHVFFRMDVQKPGRPVEVVDAISWGLEDFVIFRYFLGNICNMLEFTLFSFLPASWVINF